MLIAFEGINSVGKTHCLNTFRRILGDRYGVKSEVITSKPSIQEMEASGLYGVISNPCDVTEQDKRNIAGLFYRKQHQLGLDYKDLIESDRDVAVADRWIGSTVVYSIYYDFLKEDRKNDVENLEKYCKYISSGDVENMDISLMLKVKTQFKEIVRKFIDTLIIVNGFKPVPVDIVVNVVSPDVNAMSKNNREGKLITRWEKENISELLSNIYVVVNEVLLDLGYYKNIITIENKIMENSEAYLESLDSQFEPIYNNFFRKEPVEEIKNNVDENSSDESEKEENNEENVDVSGENNDQNIEETSENNQEENNENLFLDESQSISLNVESSDESSISNLTTDQHINLEIIPVKEVVVNENEEAKSEDSNVIREAFGYKPRTNNDQQNYRDGKKNGKWNPNYKNYRR